MHTLYPVNHLIEPTPESTLRLHFDSFKSQHQLLRNLKIYQLFTPNSQGFIGVVCHNGVAHCVFEKLPETLDDPKTHKKGSQMKMVSIGHKNIWSIVYEDGGWSIKGIFMSLIDKLKNICSVGVEICPFLVHCHFEFMTSLQSIILSPSTISNFMVTYENGASDYDVLYAQWKLAIDNQISLC